MSIAWLAFRRNSNYSTGLLKESNTRNLEWFNVCRLLGVSWSWRNKVSRPKHQGQLSAWVWKWEETVWTLGLQPSNSRATPFGDWSQKVRKFSAPRPELQLIPLASAQVPRSENKAFTPCFFSPQKSDLFLDFTSVFFICSSCNSLQMFDIGAYVERSLTSPWFGFWLAPYPLFLWLIVGLLTTLEMLGLLP